MNHLRLFVAVALAGSACGEDREELTWPVDQVGHHLVAYREYHVDYTPAGASEERTLRLAIWYPVASASAQPAKYMGSYEREGIQAGGQPIATEKFPVAVFSHGNLSFAEQSWYLGEYFASHGFLVLAPDHTGNTLVNAGGERPREIFDLRPQDISATLDAASALPALSDRASDEVVVMGHSFGGYTSFEVSLADDRIDAAIPMAAGNHNEFQGGEIAGLKKPVMLMTGVHDRSVPNATEGDLYWSELDGEDDRRVDLPRGGHHSFDIACELFPALGEGDGCGDDFVDADEAHRLISTYALAFARRHLFDDNSVSALLDGETSLSTEAVLSKK